jgi:hypothetical protein
MNRHHRGNLEFQLPLEKRGEMGYTAVIEGDDNHIILRQIGAIK